MVRIEFMIAAVVVAVTFGMWYQHQINLMDPGIPDDYALECVDDPDLVGVTCYAYCGDDAVVETEEPK